MRPYVKRSFPPMRTDMLPLALRQAFALMTNGRPGPVHIAVPLTCLWNRSETICQVASCTLPSGGLMWANSLRAHGGNLNIGSKILRL
jgi:hypothetical protein